MQLIIAYLCKWFNRKITSDLLPPPPPLWDLPWPVHQSESRWRLTPKLPVAVRYRSRARDEGRTPWYTRDRAPRQPWPFIIHSLGRNEIHGLICLLMPEGIGVPTLAFITFFSLKYVTFLTLDTLPQSLRWTRSIECTQNQLWQQSQYTDQMIFDLEGS